MATNSIYKFVLDLCRGVLLEPEHLLRGDRTCTNHQRRIRRRVVEVHIIVDISRTFHGFFVRESELFHALFVRAEDNGLTHQHIERASFYASQPAYLCQ